jgi:hypothetical protein
MLKGKYVLLSLAAALVCWQVAGVDSVNSGIVDPCKSTVATTGGNDGVVLVCPLGDGDPLNAAIQNDPIAYGAGPPPPPVNVTVLLTVRDNANLAVPGIPAVDMWLVGCNDGLLLCGGSSASNADNATSATGSTTFTNEPIAGGCDTGLYAVVQGIVIETAGTCLPTCLPIEVRSPDYKSAGPPGPPGCAGDIRCPDSRVSLADFAWFNTHYKTAANPGATYHACADYAHPIGGATTNTSPAPFTVGLADFSKFNVHYFGAGHKCPI